MGAKEFFGKIKNGVADLKDKLIDIPLGFRKDSRYIQLVNTDNYEQIDAIKVDENHFVIYKPGNKIGANSILASLRDVKYFLKSFEENFEFELEVDEEKFLIKTLKVEFRVYEDDPYSLISRIVKNASINNNVHITFTGDINNSQLSNIGNVSNMLNDPIKDWQDFKHDLQMKHDGYKYSDLIREIDGAVISQDTSDIDSKTISKAATFLGVFLGNILTTIIIGLTEYFKK